MKALFLCVVIALLINSALQFTHDPERIVFCDVGQGDGIYIRLASGQDIVIDAGMGTKMGQCLARHMNYFDRSLDLVVNTHSDKDHYGGFIEIIKRYDIGVFVLNPLKNENKDYQDFLKSVKAKGIKTTSFTKGDTINLNSTTKCNVYWPNIHSSSMESLEVNASSYIFNCSFGDLDILFTGDTDPDVINQVKSEFDPDSIEILKVPHHGSKNGLSKASLEKILPLVAIIQVGKKNSYGHPHQKIMEMITAQKSMIKLTSEGDIVVYPRKNGFNIIQ